jgi:hypothetical protein
MRELLTVVIAALVLFVFARADIARKMRLRMAGLGFGLLVVGVYQATLYQRQLRTYCFCAISCHASTAHSSSTCRWY